MRRPSPLTLVLAVVFVDMMCQGMAYPSMPSLIRLLQGGSAQDAARLYGWLMSSYAAAEIVGAPMLGLLSDRFGRRPVLIVGAFGSAGSFLVSAVAPNVATLFLGYALAGFLSAYNVVVNAAIADATAPEERAGAYGRLGAAFGVGFVVGPAIGGLIAGTGLRTPFFVSAALMALVGLAALAFLPETLRPEARRSADAGRVSPLDSLRAMARIPVVRGLAAASGLQTLALRMLIAVWVPYASYRYGFGERENGFLLTGFGLTMAASQAIIVPFAVRRFGERRALLFAVAVSVVEYVGYGLSPTWPILLAVMVVASLGAIGEPALRGIVANAAGEDEQGAVQGGLGMVGSVVGLAGPVIGASIFAASTGKARLEMPGLAYFVCAALCAGAFLVALRTLRAHPETATPR